MKPLVSIIMGSTSDLPIMEKACKWLEEQEIPFEVNALSAHRTPDAVETFAKEAKGRGVKAIIADKLDVEETEVTPEASFTNDLGADSLDTVELIMEFEKEFNIQIPDDQAEKITTVGHAIEYVEKTVNK